MDIQSYFAHADGAGAARGDCGTAGRQGCAWRELGVREYRHPNFRRNTLLSVLFWLTIVSACGIAYASLLSVP